MQLASFRVTRSSANCPAFSYGAGAGLASLSVTCLAEDNQHNVWIGFEDAGLQRWQRRGVGLLTNESGLPHENVWALCEDKDSGVWIGTDGGACLWRDGRITLSLTNQLSDSRIRALHVDAAGALWIGTGGGLDRVELGSARASRAADGALAIGSSGIKPERSAVMLNEVRREGASNGTRGERAPRSEIDQSLVISAATVTTIRWNDDKPMNKVRVIKSDRAGNLWVGRSEGLMLYRDGRWQHFTTADGLPNIDVRAIHEDRAGRLWIATHGGGVAALVTARGDSASLRPAINESAHRLTPVATFTTTNGLPSNYAWALHEDADGILWLGTERGLARVDLSRMGRTGDPPVPPGDSPDGRARMPVLDKDLPSRERVYPIPVGESPTGTGESPVLPVTAFTKAHGLFEEAINEIVEDDFGRLWLSSDRGIMRVDKRELNAIASGATNRVACVVYTESDGLPSSECNGQKSQPAGLKTRDGKLWFPTTKGVVIIDPRKLNELDSRPPVLIERIIVDGEKVFENLPGSLVPANGFRFDPGRARALEVHYTAPTFKAPEKVRFRYRLAGFDRDLVDAEARRVAYYTNLKPGKYRFEVLAANNHSLWSERPASFAFTLAPHLWQMSWFQPACWSAVLAVFGFIVWHLRRAHQIHQRIALMEERNRIARDMHDGLGSKLNRVGLALASADTGETTQTGQVSQLLISAEETLDEIVWAMKPENDRMDRLLTYLREVASDHVMAAGIEFQFEVPESLPAWPLHAEARKNILFAVKEALTNAIKHSRARCIELRVHVEDRSFTIEIVDDGIGFNVSTPTSVSESPNQLDKSYDSPALTSAETAHCDGLANMRQRMTVCGGRFEIVSQPGGGTIVRFSIPRMP